MKRIAAAVAAVIVVATGLGFLAHSSLLTTPAPACHPDPAAQIAKLPAGATFHGSGCYTTTGILIQRPVTIDGGTYNDPVASGKIKPVITVKRTTRVTVENVTITGTDTTGKMHGKLVGQAGIDVLDAQGVTLTNVTVRGVFGDCLELWAIPPRYTTPDQVTGNHLALDNCGRDGITVADVSNTTLDHVTIGNHGQAAVDAESDVASALGSFTLSDSTMSGVEISERPLAPVTFDHDAISGGQIQFLAGKATTPWAYPIVFENGSFKGTHKDVAAIVMRGLAVANFVHETLAVGGKGPLTSVQPGGVLTVNP